MRSFFTGYGLPATGYRGYRLRATGEGCRLRDRGYRLQASGTATARAPDCGACRPQPEAGSLVAYFGLKGCFAVLEAATTSCTLGLFARARWMASFVAW